MLHCLERPLQKLNENELSTMGKRSDELRAGTSLAVRAAVDLDSLQQEECGHILTLVAKHSHKLLPDWPLTTCSQNSSNHMESPFE